MNVLVVPNYIEELIKRGFLKEVDNFSGRIFDREEFRLFEVIKTDYYCVARQGSYSSRISYAPGMFYRGIPSRLDWTTEELIPISFEELFQKCPLEMKEFIIFNMDNFNGKEI